jgi:hypothetical protein
MKKLFFILFAVMFSSNFAFSQQRVPAPSQDLSQKIHIEIGRKTKDCGGFGICKFTIDITVEEFLAIVNARKTSEGKLKILMSSDFVKRNAQKLEGNIFGIEEEFVIDAATSKALGFSSSYIIPIGKYPIVYNASSRTYECTF